MLEPLVLLKEKKVKSLSRIQLLATPWTVACTRLLHPWDFLGKSTGVCLLQGIFPTQGSNPGLPHCRQMLYHLRHQGSPDSKKWLILKDCDAGEDWGQEEKGVTEDEMVGWHQWTWVWASSGRRWRTGKPGVLQSMRLQRVRHNWATEQQQLHFQGRLKFSLTERKG